MLYDVNVQLDFLNGEFRSLEEIDEAERKQSTEVEKIERSLNITHHYRGVKKTDYAPVSSYVVEFRNLNKIDLLRVVDKFSDLENLIGVKMNFAESKVLS